MNVESKSMPSSTNNVLNQISSCKEDEACLKCGQIQKKFSQKDKKI